MEFYIKEIIKLAKKAASKGDVPVGAIIVWHNKIISKAYNRREKKKDILGHAEIIAIQKAAKKINTWKLNECDLYVTLKPCVMCENIIKQSRIKNVYYLLDKLEYKKEYGKTNVCKIEDDHNYASILSSFFINKRKKKN